MQIEFIRDIIREKKKLFLFSPGIGQSASAFESLGFFSHYSTHIHRKEKSRKIEFRMKKMQLKIIWVWFCLMEVLLRFPTLLMVTNKKNRTSLNRSQIEMIASCKRHAASSQWIKAPWLVFSFFSRLSLVCCFVYLHLSIICSIRFDPFAQPFYKIALESD